MWSVVTKIAKAIFGNSKVAWTICAGVIISAAVAYNVYIIPSPEPEPINPNDPIPTLVGIDKPIPCGELVELKLIPYKIKPENLQTYAVDWKVYDGTKLVKLRQINDNLAFPAGCVVGKKYDLFVTVTYLFDKDGPVIRNHFLKASVFVDKAPPPGPGPNPDPDPKPDVEPVFPHGKFGLSKFSYDTAKRLVKSNRQADGAKAVVEAFTEVSKMIEKGEIKSSEVALATMAKTNLSTLSKYGIPVSEWDSFGVALQEKLYELDNNQTFSNSVVELRIAFIEISEGLKAIK